MLHRSETPISENPRSKNNRIKTAVATLVAASACLVVTAETYEAAIEEREEKVRNAYLEQIRKCSMDKLLSNPQAPMQIHDSLIVNDAVDECLSRYEFDATDSEYDRLSITVRQGVIDTIFTLET